MRLVSFQAKDGMRIGVISGNQVIDISSIDDNAPRDIQNVIVNDTFAQIQQIVDKASGKEMLDFDSLSYNVPISAPGKILCLGLNYLEHVDEGITSTRQANSNNIKMTL